MRAKCNAVFEIIQSLEYRIAEHGIAIGNERIVALPGIQSHVMESQEMIRYLVAKSFAFDGVFAMSDGRALGAYMGVVKMGLRVPDDVRIVGFDGVSDACTQVLNITCVQQNVPLLARRACETLMRLMEREPIPEKRIIVPVNLLPGQTT